MVPWMMMPSVELKMSPGNALTSGLDARWNLMVPIDIKRIVSGLDEEQIKALAYEMEWRNTPSIIESALAWYARALPIAAAAESIGRGVERLCKDGALLLEEESEAREAAAKSR